MVTHSSRMIRKDFRALGLLLREAGTHFLSPLYFRLKAMTLKATDGLSLLTHGSTAVATTKIMWILTMEWPTQHWEGWNQNSPFSVREQSLCSTTSGAAWQSFKLDVMGERNCTRLVLGKLWDGTQMLEGHGAIRAKLDGALNYLVQ